MCQIYKDQQIKFDDKKEKTEKWLIIVVMQRSRQDLEKIRPVVIELSIRLKKVGDVESIIRRKVVLLIFTEPVKNVLSGTVNCEVLTLGALMNRACC